VNIRDPLAGRKATIGRVYGNWSRSVPAVGPRARVLVADTRRSSCSPIGRARLRVRPCWTCWRVARRKVLVPTVAALGPWSSTTAIPGHGRGSPKRRRDYWTKRYRVTLLLLLLSRENRFHLYDKTNGNSVNVVRAANVGFIFLRTRRTKKPLVTRSQ